MTQVTNARASEDYGAGGTNWQIGASSLLLSALNLRASKARCARRLALLLPVT